MRTFELSTHMKAVSRADGESATAKAAYRACVVIECEREDRTHDYSRKGGHEAGQIVMPQGAAQWERDRAKLWNAAEMREVNKDRRAKSAFKANAQTARDYMFAYPAEMSKEGRFDSAMKIAVGLPTITSLAWISTSMSRARTATSGITIATC